MSGTITFVDSRTVLCYLFFDPNLIAGGFDQYYCEPLYWELAKTSVETVCPRPFLREGWGVRLVLNWRVF